MPWDQIVHSVLCNLTFSFLKTNIKNSFVLIRKVMFCLNVDVNTVMKAIYADKTVRGFLFRWNFNNNMKILCPVKNVNNLLWAFIFFDRNEEPVVGQSLMERSHSCC